MTISIRTKIIISQIFLVALVSVFIYNYYPYQQKKLALNAINGKVRSISNMFSIGVGIGMGETDFVAVSEAVNWANTDSSVVYISVVSTNDQSIASLDPYNLTVPSKVLEDEADDLFFEYDRIIFYKTTVTYQNKPFGKLIIGYSLKNLDLALLQLRTATLSFCLALVAAGIIISVLIGNMISRNITRLDQAVNAITEGAEDVRVDLTSNDEIGKLGKAFNHMLDKLAASRTSLINYSTKLQKQNDELNQFSYVVSHDLKAPLRAIFKLSEWIEEDLATIPSDETKKNLQTLRGRVFRMEGLINGLLEYSKIGRLEIKAEKIDTCQLIKEIIEVHNPPAHIKINVGANLPTFKTRKLALQQVLDNLIANAIKYNDKSDGVVTISAQEADAFFRFTVEDNGMGIDKNYHEKIFVIFQTLAARDKVEGTGIGLSIVKKNIEDLGGKIHVESSVGLGSKFIFTWPKEIINSKNYYN